MQAVDTPTSIEKRFLAAQQLTLYTVCGGAWATNSYVLVCQETGMGLIVDAGVALADAWNALDLDGIEIQQILLTHGHCDHIDGLARLMERKSARAYAHPADLPMISQANIYGFAWGWPRIFVPEVAGLSSGRIATSLGDITIRHTPGHTPGGVAFGLGEMLFTGDTLFRRSGGRTDLPGGNAKLLRETITSLLETLPATTRCFPGHGRAFLTSEVELPS